MWPSVKQEVALTWLHPNSIRFLWTCKQFSKAAQIFYISPRVGFCQARDFHCSWKIGPIGLKISFNEQIENKEGRKVCNWAVNSKKYNLSICFHIHRRESGKNPSECGPSEAHLQSSNTSRGSYLDTEQSIVSKYLNSISWPSPFTVAERSRLLEENRNN